jgi:CHAT domain-containing protein/tetratricopeptide (TPR) repeat protein
LELASEARWRSGDVRSSRAIDDAARALGIRERRLGPDHVDVAKSLIALGRAKEECSIAGADSLLRRALAVREAHLAADDTLVAAALQQVGLAEYELGNTSEALQLGLRALAIREKLLGPDHPDVAASLLVLALVFNSQGDYGRARTSIDQSLAIMKRTLGTEHPLYAQGQAVLSLIMRLTGRFDEAIRAAQTAIDIQTRALGPDHVSVGYSYSGLGDSYTWGGRYREGFEARQRGLTILEKALGPDDPSLAWPLSGVGELLHAFGDESRSQEMLERALALRENHLPPLHPDVALMLDRLGEVYQENGECDRARPLLERALAIRRQILPKGHVDIATSLYRLATCYVGLGEPARARPLLEEAVPIFEHTEGPIDPMGWGFCIEAELAYADGNYARADRLFARAVGLFKNNGPAGMAGAEYGAGVAELARNRLDAARVNLTNASSHWAEVCGPEHYARALPLPALSLVELRLGHPRDAFETAFRAEEIERSEVRWNVRALPEDQGLRVTESRLDALDMMLDIVATASILDARFDSLALDALVRSRAVVLDEVGSRHHPPAARSDSSAAALAERYRVASRRLASIEVRGQEGQGPALYRQLLDEARRDRDRAEQALVRRSAAFRAETARNAAGLNEVRAAIGAHEALVSIGRYDPQWIFPAATIPTRRRSTLPPAYVAFVLRHGEHAPAVVPLGDAARIEKLVAEWRRAVNPGESGGRGGDEASYRTAAARLRSAVWDPIARELNGVTHVFVVPDGALQFVNWGTMPVGGDRYLVESGPLISYLSAERDLAVAASTGHGEGLLAIGAPDFDADLAGEAVATVATAASGGNPYRGPHTPCADFSTVRFEPLPAAELELGDVTAAWRGEGRTDSTPADPAQRTLGPATELTGRQATESAFTQLAPGRRVIHIATHAFFTGAGCVSKPGDRGIGAMIPAPTRMPSPPEENPLLLSGLVFAGANHRDRAGPDEDDGILTAEEIAALDLSGVEWAVLSGCDTGVGEQSPGEGVLGLRRAFEVAGVRTLVLSLWSVEDRATRQWMRRLYAARLERGMSTSTAVQQACLETLRERRARHESTHPSTWGAFVSIGDWR